MLKYNIEEVMDLMRIHGLRLDQKTDKKGLKRAQHKLAHPKPFVCGITLNIVMLPPNSVRSYILKTVQNNIKQSLNIVMLPPNVAIIYSQSSAKHMKKKAVCVLKLPRRPSGLCGVPQFLRPETPPHRPALR